MNVPNLNSPRSGDVVVYKGTASAETYLLSIFQRASHLSSCQRDEAMRDAMAFATRDHVDAWYTEDGQAYKRMARHRVQQQRRAILAGAPVPPLDAHDRLASGDLA